MSKLPKSEVFSVLHMPELQDAPPPAVDAAHALFRSLRPSLEDQSWDPDRSYTANGATHYTGSDFSRREMTVDDNDRSGFKGDLTWLVYGPPELTLADHPLTSDRVEERLYVNSLDWRQQASMQFTRNVTRFTTVDLSKGGTENSYLTDLRSLVISFEADAPNDTDRLRMTFDASSGFFPNGHIIESSRVINGAPALYREIDPNNQAARSEHIASMRSENMRPRADDIRALRESVALLKAALAYLRRTTPS